MVLMVQTCNPSAQEGEAGESGVPYIVFTKKKRREGEGGRNEGTKEVSKQASKLWTLTNVLAGSPAPTPVPGTPSKTERGGVT